MAHDYFLKYTVSVYYFFENVESFKSLVGGPQECREKKKKEKKS